MESEIPAYKEFRTGLTFKEVRHILKLEAKRKYERGQYMFITRATVLGRWHELKKNMYAQEEKYFQLAIGDN